MSKIVENKWTQSRLKWCTGDHMGFRDGLKTTYTYGRGAGRENTYRRTSRCFMACRTRLSKDVTEILHDPADYSCLVPAKSIRHLPNRERLMIASDAIYSVSSVHNLRFMGKVHVAKKFRLTLSAGIKLQAQKAKASGLVFCFICKCRWENSAEFVWCVNDHSCAGLCVVHAG